MRNQKIKTASVSSSGMFNRWLLDIFKVSSGGDTVTRSFALPDYVTVQLGSYLNLDVGHFGNILW